VQILGELHENLLAPELYATAATSFSTASGILTITFASSRVDNSDLAATRRQVVVFRVSMPVIGAANLATALFDFLNKQGVQFATSAERERPQ
jgi:hypothetical protein